MISADTRDPVVRARLDAVIAEAAPHLAVLLAAVRYASSDFLQVPQDAGSFDCPATRPTIVLVSDDYEESFGPAAFDLASLKRCIGRADFALIVAGAPEVALYAGAADVAASWRRHVVIVETRPEHEADWARLIQAARPGIAVVISTPAGPSEDRH